MNAVESWLRFSYFLFGRDYVPARRVKSTRLQTTNRRTNRAFCLIKTQITGNVQTDQLQVSYVAIRNSSIGS